MPTTIIPSKHLRTQGLRARNIAYIIGQAFPHAAHGLEQIALQVEQLADQLEPKATAPAEPTRPTIAAGQRWRNRDGRIVTITPTPTDTGMTSFCWTATAGASDGTPHTYTVNAAGRQLSAVIEASGDLMELLSTPVREVLAAGQKWRTGGGAVVVISKADPARKGAVAGYDWCATSPAGQHYVNDDGKSHYTWGAGMDLVQLLPDTATPEGCPVPDAHLTPAERAAALEAMDLEAQQDRIAKAYMADVAQLVANLEASQDPTQGPADVVAAAIREAAAAGRALSVLVSEDGAVQLDLEGEPEPDRMTEAEVVAATMEDKTAPASSEPLPAPFTPWNGKGAAQNHCPVPPDTMVCIKMRDGAEAIVQADKVGWWWRSYEHGGDIVGYHVLDATESAAPLPTDASGYTSWDGSRDFVVRPDGVYEGTQVIVKWRNDTVEAGAAGDFRWSWGTKPRNNDILAYRVVVPAATPTDHDKALTQHVKALLGRNDTFGFGAALELMRLGRPVRRKSWEAFHGSVTIDGDSFRVGGSWMGKSAWSYEHILATDWMLAD